MEKYDVTYIFTTLIVILAGLIPFAFELIKKEETNTIGMVLLTSILIFVAFYFVYTFIWNNVKKYTQQIETNTKKINEIEKKLNYKEDFYRLEKRISILEAKNERKRSN